MVSLTLQEKLAQIPHKPGCYLWKNGNGEVIYVGKAKNLAKRTAQYFKGVSNLRTLKLVSEIRDIDYFIVSNERESLLLEFNLVKQYMPVYNVLLKNESGYPYILVTNEKHPRLLYVRNYQKSRGKYYGPFPDGSSAYQLYVLLTQLFPLKKCPNQQTNRKCLYYDIGECLGSCFKDVPASAYDKLKHEIDDLMHGKFEPVVEVLRTKELNAVEIEDFEGAQKYHELSAKLINLEQKQNIHLSATQDTDFIGFYCENGYLAIMIFAYREGKMTNKHEYIGEYNPDDEIGDVVSQYLLQYYSQTVVPDKIYVSLNSETNEILSEQLKTKFINHIKGQQGEILQLAVLNSKNLLTQNINKYNQEVERSEGAVRSLCETLNIEYPKFIDIIDNSHNQGAFPISAVVVYRDGIKAKNLYRKYTLNPENRNDDLANMYEVVLRRYHPRALSKINKPGLIIVDGALNQVLAAKKALEEVGVDIPLVGAYKNDKHQSEGLINLDGHKMPFDKGSKIHLLISNMQTEVHRFAINFYKLKHKKSFFASLLDGIEGLGEKKKALLIENFATLGELSNASVDQLAQFVKRDVAEKILERINQTKRDQESSS